MTSLASLALLLLLSSPQPLDPAPAPATSPLTAATAAAFLQPGDLLFQDIDCGPLCDAIETVTQGACGAHFSHVGIVSKVDGSTVYVVEAIGPGVIETPLDKFLGRSADSKGRPKVLVGRTNLPQGKKTQAVANALTLLGLPYDNAFVINNNFLYCSELVHEAFRFQPDGTPLFDLAPMTFLDPATSQFFPAWVTWYAELGIPIPQGQPGTNPGAISRSNAVAIIQAFGLPSGLATPCNSLIDQLGL